MNDMTFSVTSGKKDRRKKDKRKIERQGEGRLDRRRRLDMSHCEKINNLGPDQVRHEPACKVTEAGWKLEISDVRRRGIVLSM